MSRKTTAALIAALGINFALAGGAVMLANLNKPAEFDYDTAFAVPASDIKQVAGVLVDHVAGDLAVPLQAAQHGGNARVTFTCGKQIPSGREVHEGTWDQITGAVLYRPESQSLLAIEAVFDTRSLRTDTQALTNTVTAKEQWFDTNSHPLATFTCDTIKVIDAATPSHTHDLVGTFTLNGITKPITIPAKVSFSGQSLTIDAVFMILRSDFKVEKRETSLAGSVGSVVSKVEDEVELTVRVAASPDPIAVIGDLARKVEKQEEQLRHAAAEIKLLNALTRRIELIEEKANRPAVGIGAKPAADSSTDNLPKRYTDQSPDYIGVQQFDMVLVPGDADKGIAPFYMSTHEVTWGMVEMWMYMGDLEQSHTPEERYQLVLQGIRPSPLYEDPAQFVQVPDRDNPAIAMSMLTAKSFCVWLSEKTGRHYRLPTLAEWQHAMKLGGGLPEDLDSAAWHKDNAQRDFLDKILTGKVGSKQPNKLGIYDMFGNACEWVTGTGVDKVVVGGHYHLPANQFTEDWQAVEDVEVWNKTHPQTPKGRFWISDFHYSGLRLVCEPASVAANPPVE